MANLRIRREIQKLGDSTSNGIYYYPHNDDIYTWDITMELSDTKNIRLELTLPENFPYKPPKVQVISRLQNQYVYDSGSICLDILGPTWSPSMTIEAIMVGILSLLKEEPHVASAHKGSHCCCSVRRCPH
jgi:ubiquitin-protein ligase